MCGMCEAHMNEAIRKAVSVQKVTSSHSKGETVILSKNLIAEDTLRRAIAPTGYKMLAFDSQPYEKKGFLGLW